MRSGSPPKSSRSEFQGSYSTASPSAAIERTDAAIHLTD
jgi:hypothetical protein